jgi:arylsulfatase A-like enzyme
MSSFSRSFHAIICSFVAVVLIILLPVSTPAQVFAGHPKLIVIVVIDQFRGDYLQRDRSEFKGRGFKLFMDEGAWFTDCYFDYANTKTAPGHATIGTGAYTDGHGINANDYWDTSRSYTHKVSAVEDERYQLVGLPTDNQSGGSRIGTSPRNLRATTLGDELRLATQGRARVYGVSIKDRAAILPAGQAANGAFWVDGSSGQFITSSYYMEHLPEWARTFNASDRKAVIAREAGVKDISKSFGQVLGTPAANRYELDFAKALITGEKLGQNGVTDLLVVSLSPNDIQGHQFGPDSKSEEQMILGLDKDLDGFNSWLDQTVGLKNVWLALTADHGVAPLPGEAAKLGIHSAVLDMNALYAKLDEGLNARFSPGKQAEYLMPDSDMPYIILDRRVFEKLGVDEKTAEDYLATLLPEDVASQAPQPEQAGQRIPSAPQVSGVYTRLEMAHGQLPLSEMGRMLGHSYADHGTWNAMLVLDAYQEPGTGAFSGTTHYTPWSYDRHVPLAFFGTPFIPGEYHERVAPVDLAVTLASLAGVNQPSAAVGRVLTEALKPIKPTRQTAGQ